MSQNEQTYWKIHDFLKDRLDGDVLHDFQQEMAQNDALREEVEMHRIANKLIINNRLTAAKQTSLNIQKTEKQAELYKKIAIGTAITITIISAIYLIFNKQQASQVKISPQNISAISSFEKTERMVVPKTDSVYLDNGRSSDLVNGKPTKTLVQKHSIKTIEVSAKEVPISNLNNNELLFIQNTELNLPKQAETKQEIALESISAKKEIENFCLKTAISAIAFASTTCANESEGSISVSDFKGGKAPYKFEIVAVESGNILKNNRLASGKYTVIITDDNHCKATIENIVVKEVNCANEEVAFNPFLGETFQLEAFPKVGTFVIREKTGAIVYKKQVLADEKIEWNGMSQNGELETGHFAYEIVFEDGTRKMVRLPSLDNAKNRRYIVLLFGLFLVIQGYSQTFVLPDSNFRKCLQTRYSAVLNAGGQLITAEAAKLTGSFACINQKISNADGIQYFTGLSVLQLNNNNISYIPSLVDLKNLVELDLGQNRLTTLPDISKLSKLKSLSVEQNDLIALPDLSPNNLIDNLVAHNNNLTSLPNLDKLTKLSYVNISYNKLTSLPNLDKLVSLTTLYCWVNELTSLPRLDSLKNLRNLHVFLNKLTVAPTLPKNNKIESVFLNDNKISTLVDYSSNSSLVKVRLYNNYGLSFKEYLKLTTKSGYDTIFKLSPQQKLVVGKTQTAHENDTIYLSTGIDKGVAGVRYDWFKNGTFYKSATNDLLAIPKCTFADSGYYACHIRHSAFAGFSLATDSFKVDILPCVEFGNFAITSTEINCLNTGTISISGDLSQIGSFELKGINSGKIQTSTNGKFIGLSEPAYKMKAIAKNGCSKEYANSIIVSQKECEEAILSPDGDGLSDNYFFPENGKVTIYDKFGKTIRTLTIPAEWNGTSEKGTVPMGFYVADVNNGKRFVGITVLY